MGDARLNEGFSDVTEVGGLVAAVDTACAVQAPVAGSVITAGSGTEQAAGTVLSCGRVTLGRCM